VQINSRDPDLLAPFAARGFVSGMWPAPKNDAPTTEANYGAGSTPTLRLNTPRQLKDDTTFQPVILKDGSAKRRIRWVP